MVEDVIHRAVVGKAIQDLRNPLLRLHAILLAGWGVATGFHRTFGVKVPQICLVPKRKAEGSGGQPAFRARFTGTEPIVYIQGMFADATRLRPALVATTLLFWVVWAGAFGIFGMGDSSGLDAGARTGERLRGPAVPSAPGYTLQSHQAVVPSPTRPPTLLGQKRGGGQGSLPTAAGTPGATYLLGVRQASSLAGREPVPPRAARRSPEHLPRPPPVLSVAG
jgi:hypothetical protein